MYVEVLATLLLSDLATIIYVPFSEIFILYLSPSLVYGISFILLSSSLRYTIMLDNGIGQSIVKDTLAVPSSSILLSF